MKALFIFLGSFLLLLTALAMLDVPRDLPYIRFGAGLTVMSIAFWGFLRAYLRVENAAITTIVMKGESK